MTFDKINIDSDKKWNHFVDCFADSNMFHTTKWLRVLELQYGFKPFIYCAIDLQGNVVAGIPLCEVKTILGEKKWISLPFSDYSTPLFYEQEVFMSLLNSLIKECSDHNIQQIELRSDLPSHDKFNSITDHVLHIAELPSDPDELFRKFKKTRVQQPINKSIDLGLKSYISNSEESLNTFYNLHVKTRKKLGVPVQPRKYFTNLYNNLILTNDGFIAIVHKEMKPLSAGIFIGHNRILTYKYSSSDPKSLSLRPNNLMLWAGLKEGISRGYTLVDFGKTEINNTGLRNFKSGWGAEEKPLSYSYYPAVSKNKSIIDTGQKIITPLIKYSPKLFCRIMGEIFYKYIA